jgi:hypothetical protein
VHAQHRDQERVDLHVEPRAERSLGPGTAGDVAVDRVEHEPHRGDGDQERHPRLPEPPRHDQCRDHAGQYGARCRDPVRRTQVNPMHPVSVSRLYL